MRIVVSLPLVLHELHVPNARSRVYKRLPRRVKGMGWRHCAISVSPNVFYLFSLPISSQSRAVVVVFAFGYRETRCEVGYILYRQFAPEFCLKS
jgi:hypothetical protein